MTTAIGLTEEDAGSKASLVLVADTSIAARQIPPAEPEAATSRDEGILGIAVQMAAEVLDVYPS